jgi:signal transduction histidine kinase
VVKHAKASRASVRASIDDGVLTLEVRDDGVGGADPAGHGSSASPTGSTHWGAGCKSKALTAAGPR